MTPKQAIEEASKNGFCRIVHKTYLWETKQAAAAIRVDTRKPYILIVDGDWSVPVGVSGVEDKRLIEVCK